MSLTVLDLSIFFLSTVSAFFSVCSGAAFFAFKIVSLINEQYRSIDRLASSFPGIGKSMPIGSEFVSSIATIGMPSFIAVSYTHLTLPTNREV